jgi:hypothetical protein
MGLALALTEETNPVFKMSMLKAFENIPIVIRKEGMM